MCQLFFQLHKSKTKESQVGTIHVKKRPNNERKIKTTNHVNMRWVWINKTKQEKKFVKVD